MRWHCYSSCKRICMFISKRINLQCEIPLNVLLYIGWTDMELLPIGLGLVGLRILFSVTGRVVSDAVTFIVLGQFCACYAASVSIKTTIHDHVCYCLVIFRRRTCPFRLDRLCCSETESSGVHSSGSVCVVCCDDIHISSMYCT